jgi:energy-coupling factor transporter ATP-binding protein EcfA2
MLDNGTVNAIAFRYNIGTTEAEMEGPNDFSTKPVHRATLSQSQGRAGWSVIFRHPVRVDPATGKPGWRVRAGLGTRDRGEAEYLASQLSEILASPDYWEPSARPLASGRFDTRVVEIFYRELSPEGTDFVAVRDHEIPLASSTEGYRQVLLLGTTGAGKTTLVRQILGTDQTRERFPSTSTAKTTIADTEIVITEGARRRRENYRVVVTFLSQPEVRGYVEECMSAAALAFYRGMNNSEVLRRLLRHVDQRFRLDYILGPGPIHEDDDLDDENDGDSQGEGADVQPEELGKIDLSSTNDLLQAAIAQLKELAQSHGKKLAAELEAVEPDKRVLEERFEEELDDLLRRDEVFLEIGDQLMDEIDKRFELLNVGKISRTRQAWPLAWSYTTSDRREFVRSVLQFSSNFAPYFGRLLTPLVNGIRVAGPFAPQWSMKKSPKFVLFDGEGLGHTLKSAANVPAAITRQFEKVDAVILVDSAKQPMQAAPVAVMRALVRSGNVPKLFFCFTHFDAVTGDNLPNVSARKNHILESVENVLASIGEDLGPFAEAVLRRRLNCACHFVGGIQKALNPDKGADRRTIAELDALLNAIASIVPQEIRGPGRPVYDRTKLVKGIIAGASSFQETWRALLGRTIKPGINKEHWTRIKALTRRIAFRWSDEYQHLTPGADLYAELQNRMLVFIQQPDDWDGSEPGDEERETIFSNFTDKLSKRLLTICARRVISEHVTDWQRGYDLHGARSTFARAALIDEDIYVRAAPIPDVTASPDTDSLLEEVMEVVKLAASEAEVVLR